jgi:antitoxin VapB
MDILAIGSYHWYQSISELHMDTARLFQSGRSQAVRLPKEYRFVGTEVVVKHFGNGVLLLPMNDPWQTLEAGLATFEPGFVLTRAQPDDQLRAEIAP